MAEAKKKKAEIKQDPDAPPEVLPPGDGVAPGSVVRDLPDSEKPDPATVAQEEEVKGFPPTEPVS